MAELDVNPMSHKEPDDVYHPGHRPAPRAHPSHVEGALTQVIEQQTARIPSGLFLVAAILAMAGSVVFQVGGRYSASRFVGLWAPTLLIAGVYNKLVKSLGTS